MHPKRLQMLLFILAFCSSWMLLSCGSEPPCVYLYKTCYGTISEAIDAAAPGSWIVISAGVFEEQIKMKKVVHLVGKGSDSTIIDGMGLDDPVINIGGFLENDITTISGVTIRNGSIGITCGVNAELSDSVITDVEIGVWARHLKLSRVMIDAPDTCVLSQGGRNGFKESGVGDITGCRFRCGIGIRTGLSLVGDISGNEFLGCDVGIQASRSWFDRIEFNRFPGTRIAIEENSWDRSFLDLGGGSRGSKGGNDFNGVRESVILHRFNYALSARFNCWGTMDPNAINSLILDCQDDPKYGCVDFSGFHGACQ